MNELVDCRFDFAGRLELKFAIISLNTKHEIALGNTVTKQQQRTHNEKGTKNKEKTFWLNAFCQNSKKYLRTRTAIELFTVLGFRDRQRVRFVDREWELGSSDDVFGNNCIQKACNVGVWGSHWNGCSSVRRTSYERACIPIRSVGSWDVEA